jgi:uncharacterized protein (TIGR00645 family)
MVPNPKPDNVPPGKTEAASARLHRLEHFMSRCDWLIYESRWLLFPINLGLVLALAAYVLNFIWQDIELLRQSLSSSSETLRVLILGAVDTAMVANLLVMIIKGSHQIFIRRFENVGTNKPQWLDHIDSGILKIKVALSIASITLVQILKDFVNIEQVHWDIIVHRMWMHGMCLVSALVMALIWRLTHSSTDYHSAHSTPAADAQNGSGSSPTEHH